MNTNKSQLGKRYKIIKNLGKGAQGTVDLAEDKYFSGKQIAIKTLRFKHNESKQDEQWLKLFKKEFEFLAGLHHPKLASVYDFGTTTDGQIFFTRDYIEGLDLFSAVEGFDAQKLVSTAVEICRALRPLHQAGLIHGDLKPGNIILNPKNIIINDNKVVNLNVHLIDFSFAKVSNKDAAKGGTVQYLAPEIIEEKYTDVRTDLYALGVTLYELAGGKVPFDGTVLQIIEGHLGNFRPVLKPIRIETKNKK